MTLSSPFDQSSTDSPRGGSIAGLSEPVWGGSTPSRRLALLHAEALTDQHAKLLERIDVRYAYLLLDWHRNSNNYSLLFTFGNLNGSFDGKVKSFPSDSLLVFG
ncbi:hypothetical protein A7K73_10545 [Candidatus Methylacidiphilum fumarolicum]|uniref:Uncharacterized protein n=1 Tax=Candidatus Methylacidiphilum fumarolicum TaxID=591154 RepID=A0ABM9IDM5_9BACT|nr:hypothetical protein [Candidatus Methylacidiphilum fumarolicum]MBW6415791.1 hypothetical protein [Candidatus Methylacidiphilum fumarolicum]TFE66299.1 hypothetical protein A7K73_10545 [Candidatus Methylacidiphilum fumarolicum]CAI9085792.1 conserved protein of unknown function [Candidatus Methylacidiphilum fumarolicum]